ncbi:T-cell receptor alpha chain V region 2B4, partial [Sciurus carolinensis]|nr:T-cell receptor alpha chain V region 2B4 [Sciurus carolinensis]
QVEQSPSALSLQEGTSHTLTCNFSTAMNNVQWFRQNPGSGLIRLFFLTSGTKQEGRLKATMNFRERYSTLDISTSQLEDSGTYLCAAGAQYSQGTCSLSPNCSCTCSHSLCLREDLASSVCTALSVLVLVGCILIPSIIIDTQC